MKWKFGFKNGCYWRIITDLETALMTWQGMSNEDYVTKNINKGNCLLINGKGGYHCDSADCLVDIHESDNFPSPEDRIEALEKK